MRRNSAKRCRHCVNGAFKGVCARHFKTYDLILIVCRHLGTSTLSTLFYVKVPWRTFP